MNKQVPITVGHSQDKVIGKAEFIDNSVLIDGHPTGYVFEPTFKKNEDGTMELMEISIVPKKKTHIIFAKVTDELFRQLSNVGAEAFLEVDEKLIEDEKCGVLNDSLNYLLKL